mgnify:CR=1 FL=1
MLLKREGVTVNHKRLVRIYREARLTVRRPGGRKHTLGRRAPLAIPQGANRLWSLDLVHDHAARQPPLPHIAGWA